MVIVRDIMVAGLLSVGLLGSVASAAERTAVLPLKIVHADLPLPGKPDQVYLPIDRHVSAKTPSKKYYNRFDYASIDPQKRLLFISHLGANSIDVVDLHNNHVIANIKSVPAAHGVLAVPELDEVFANATGINQLEVISEKTLQIIAYVPTGIHPDGMAYAPKVHELFISDETGQTETVVDIRNNRRVATIAMGGEVGNSQYDPVSQRIYADVQTRNEIVAIDPRSNSIVQRYHLPDTCVHDHGLLIDAPARLAFVACDGNNRLLVLDMQDMHTLSVHRTGRHPDVFAFDPGLQRLYVASESGVVAVFQLKGEQLQLLGRNYLAYEAHSVAVDPKTHRVYFPLQNVDGRGVLRIMRPKM